MANVHNIKQFIDRRRKLRDQSTETESIMWNVLRRNNLGVKFKRQHSVGGYILDFYCAEKRLVVELDGEIHDSQEQKEYDEIRDTYFRELEYKVVRFKNSEIKNDLKGVILRIKENL